MLAESLRDALGVVQVLSVTPPLAQHPKTHSCCTNIFESVYNQSNMLWCRVRIKVIGDQVAYDDVSLASYLPVAVRTKQFHQVVTFDPDAAMSE